MLAIECKIMNWGIIVLNELGYYYWEATILIYSSHKYFLSTSKVLGIVLGVGNTALDTKREKSTPSF